MPNNPAPIHLPPERVVERLRNRVAAEVCAKEELEVAVEMLIERLTEAAEQIAKLEVLNESLLSRIDGETGTDEGKTDDHAA